MDQTKVLGSEAVKKARWEHLELLASDTGLDLEEMDTVFQVNEIISNSNLPLDRKARFARVRAARGWAPAYQGSYIHPPHQLQPLEPPPHTPGG